MARVDPTTVLPLELFTKILSHLSMNEWFNAKLVSKSWDSYVDSYLWASSINSDAMRRRGGVLSSFNARTLNSCIKLAFGGESTVEIIKYIRISLLRNQFGAFDYQMEQCLEALCNNTIPYKGKSIGRLELVSHYGVRQEYLTNLIPITDLSIINGGGPNIETELESILSSQQSSLAHLYLRSNSIKWNSSTIFRPIKWTCLFIDSVELSWETCNPGAMFGLFLACPNLKHARFAPCVLDPGFLTLLCMASSDSLLNTLYIDNVRDGPGRGRWEGKQVEGVPCWPTELKSLSLFGLNEFHFEGLVRGPLILENLAIGRCRFGLKAFLDRFCRSTDGWLMERLSLSGNCPKGLILPFNVNASEISQFPNLVYLNLRSQQIDNENLETFLPSCPELRRVDVGYTNVTRRGLLSLAKRGCKLIGVEGLQISTGVVQEVGSYGTKCVNREITMY